jgi:hypothetical protein
MDVFFDREYTNKKIEFISYILYFVINSFIYLTLNIPILSLISNIISYFLISFNYQSNLKKRLLAIFLIYIIFLLIEILIVILSGFLNYSIYFKNQYFSSILGIIGIKIVSYIVVLILSKTSNIKDTDKISITYWLAILFIPLGTILIIIILLELNELSNVKLIIGISIMFIINIITFSLYDNVSNMYKSKMESEILKQQNIHYSQQYDLMKSSIDKTNSINHDIKKHILMLDSLIKRNQKDKAIEYISEILNLTKNNKIISNSGNIAIDSIINFKLQEVYNLNIKLDTIIFVPHNLNIADFDLTIILGNLIDNAIEGTSKLVKNRYINLKLTYKKNTFFIHIENSFNGKLKYIDNRLTTLYKNNDKHGYGLLNIKSAINKYDGILEINHTEQIFTVDVMLYTSK